MCCLACAQAGPCMWRAAWVRSLAKAWLSQAWRDHVHLLHKRGAHSQDLLHVHIASREWMLEAQWKLNHPVRQHFCNKRQGQQLAVPHMQTKVVHMFTPSCLFTHVLHQTFRPATHLTAMIMCVAAMCALQISCNVVSLADCAFAKLAAEPKLLWEESSKAKLKLRYSPKEAYRQRPVQSMARMLPSIHSSCFQ